MKVLGTGWAKTGTTSLAEALRTCGFKHRSQSINLVRYLNTNKSEQIFKVADRYDSFEDWPWLLLYKEFDQRYRGTKFVLTTRNPESWIVSYRKQLSRAKNNEAGHRIRRKLYGLPFPNVTDAQLIERYLRHNESVRSYFADRPDDLLEVDWSAVAGWEELCAFLNVPVPDAPFPHANAALPNSRAVNVRPERHVAEPART